MDTQTAYLLELEAISKSFPGVQALRDVTMRVQAGTVHALVGENGAGKSTLLKILFGVYKPDKGMIRIAGQPIVISDPKHAYRAGIAMIHQELQQIPELNVTQNIFLGQVLTRYRLFKDTAAMNRQARSLLKRLDVDIDVNIPVRNLSIAQRQLIEIARALLGNARIIAMDEPTSSLTPSEFEVLTRVIQDLQTQGVAIIYVSHRLNEIFRLATRATVLRDGECVGDVELAKASEEDIVSMMVGRKLGPAVKPVHVVQGSPILKVKGLSWGSRVRDVSFDLYRGEILGIAGLVGAGRTELMRLIAGLEKPTAGVIELDGQVLSLASARQAIRAGIGMLPEDRKRSGIIPLLPVLSNASLPVIERYTRAGILNNRSRRSQIEKIIDQVNLRPRSVDRPIRYFSGGNQQKAVLARWLNAESKILIFDEPTRGIDVGAKQEIYAIMETLAAAGKAILMVSSELPEVLRLSDRVLVMSSGRISATLTREEMSEERIMHHAIGDTRLHTTYEEKRG